MRSPAARVGALLGAVVATSAVLTVTVPDPTMACVAAGPVAFVLVALGFLVAERVVFDIEHRREAISFSLAEVPLAFALVFLAPWAAVLARLVGALTAQLMRRRSAPLKLAFNGAVFALETMVAATVVRRLDLPGGTSHDARLLLLVLVALAASSVAGALLVSCAVACFEGDLTARFRAQVVAGAPVLALGAVLGALSLAPALADRRLVVLPLVPIVVVWRLVVRRGELAQRYRDLEGLHAFSGQIGQWIDLGELATEAQVEIRRLLRAEHAGLVVFDPVGGHVLYESTSGDPVVLPVRADDPAWAGLLGSRQPARVEAHDGTPVARALADAGHHELLVAPIIDDQGLLGCVVLADRAGRSDRFLDDDRRRLRTLVDQLAANVRKGLLHARMEHEATHDRLTGLPNRASFERLLDEALAEGPHGVGVLMIDLDRFKEVNDTLGHHVGDQLLRQFAQRAGRAVGLAGTVARFAGDEFAVLVPGTGGTDPAALAARILDETRPPFSLEDLSVAVACSIGVAVAPDHGTDGPALLRRADIAMYAAKSRSSGAELYRADMDSSSADRLALIGELRLGLDAGELEVFFQPKIDLARNTVTGAEALVRWHHPRHGLLTADRFIELAERTDLIHRLSDQVLRQSLQAVVHWRARGLTLGVAVNYSARSLFDELLADRVAHHLDEHGVSPELLTIEITESSVMTDVHRAVSTLRRLRDLGVQVAIDDYGTGYSSLSYLRRLPVTELKIDRGFITNLLVDPHDEVIVRSTIDLARHLGLRLVAEGVENDQVAARLTALGCHVGQGYGFSRPLPLDKFDRWLRVTSYATRAGGVDRPEVAARSGPHAPRSPYPPTRRRPGPPVAVRSGGGASWGVPVDPVIVEAERSDDGAAPRPRRPALRRVLGGLAALVVVAAAAYGIGARRSSPGPAADDAALGDTVRTAVADALAKAAEAPPDAARVYQLIAPSLVVIRTDRAGEDGDDADGLGTGVVINEVGAILTARHVVAGARRISLTYADGTEATATIETEEPEHDIAVLTADRPPEVIVPAVMGRGPQVGDATFAVGHPMGLVWSLSAGVVSALDRSIPVRGGVELDGLIQFDAAVNPGNSGGPLLNRAGQVIGIVSALANPSDQGFFIGIGFAVPIGTASGAAGGPAQ